MTMRIAAVTALALMVLACGGAGAPEIPAVMGPAVGPYAASMATHMSTENPGVPCAAYNLGDEVRVGDFTYRVDEVLLAEPVTKLPWIKNSDERHMFAKEGVTGLVFYYSVRNETPVKKRLDAWMGGFGNDGEKLYWGPYNENLAREARGIPEPPYDAMPPMTWVPMAAVAAIQPGAAPGAVGYITQKEKQFDPTDPSGRRKIDVLLDHAIVDLGAPAPGPSLMPAE